MGTRAIHLFSKNDIIKIEKVSVERENQELYQNFGIRQGAEALILWKSKGKIILKTEKNKLAISKRAAEKILASLL